MSTPLYDAGHSAAFSDLGITKEAQIGKILGTAAKWVGKKAPGWGKGIKEFMVGSPIQFTKELMGAKPTGKMSLLRESFHAPKLWQKGLFYGLPAYDVYSQAKMPGPDRAERMLGALGGHALGLATWRPLGMMGSMLLGGVGSRIGSGLASTGKKVIGRGSQISPYGSWEMGPPVSVYKRMQASPYMQPYVNPYFR